MKNEKDFPSSKYGGRELQHALRRTAQMRGGGMEGVLKTRENVVRIQVHLRVCCVMRLQ